jgi:hypothetical protein
MIKMMLQLTIAIFLASCANSGNEPAPSSTAEPKPSPGPQPEVKPNQSADVAIAKQGQIRFSLNQENLMDHVQAYVIGAADRHRASRESPNAQQFIIREIPDGTYDIMLTALDPDTLDAAQPTIYGKRINGIRIQDGDIVKLGGLDLGRTIALTGSVQAVSGTVGGAQVMVAGSDLKTTTDADGNFRLQGLPPGFHRLLIQKDGFHSGRIEAFSLREPESAAEPVAIGNIWLLAEQSDPAGLFSPATMDQPANELAVPFITLAPETTNEMRFAEQPDLEGIAWQPLKSSFQYTFTTAGEKTLYIQFAREGSQLSQVYRHDLSVELP